MLVRMPQAIGCLTAPDARSVDTAPDTLFGSEGLRLTSGIALGHWCMQWGSCVLRDDAAANQVTDVLRVGGTLSDTFDSRRLHMLFPAGM